ncbi:alpha/beta fold hydrolase [Corynebacterium breve]|uniref:Alpha/beta fold hydrolase n=1 Tax=Corynebacterium breve TaxID=3049799 RepID=A0ABY8VGI1_9CORY|nr:alpha/beta fold hydrolase [Corynebacterium breve]WIM68609.1 alpha/beta fold hydrolase [Corynebacterium breve]
MLNPISSITKRTLGIAIAVFVAAAGVTSPAVAETPNIAWEHCPVHVDATNAECGRIEVPMHYDDPDGPKVSLGFLRIKAEAPGARRGVLFGNPGGPGGDAYSYFGTKDGYFSWPQDIRNEWDLIAVQPRGLAHSSPLNCEVDEPADPIQAMQLSSDAVLNAGGFSRAACEKSHPGFTSSITTENNARDWNEVRRALGEDQISIMGLSYGTYLGSAFATMYPQNTDRVVLDSAMDPALAWQGTIKVQKAGYEKTLHSYFEWVAANNDRFGMGDTPLKAYQYWSNKVVAETGTNPTVVPPPAQVGDLPPGLEFAGQAGADALTSSGKARVEGEGIVSRMLNPGANQAYSPLLAATRQLVPAPHFWEELAKATNGTGDLLAPQELSDELAAEMTAQATASSQLQAIQLCNENVYPADHSMIPAAVWANYVTGDIFDAPPALAAAGAMCNGTGPVTGLVPLDGSRLRIRPLQVQGTNDPQTPYQYRGGISEPMGTHLVTVHGPGHGHVGFGNKVVDQIVIDYLRGGEVSVTDAPGYFEAR